MLSVSEQQQLHEPYPTPTKVNRKTPIDFSGAGILFNENFTKDNLHMARRLLL